MANLHGIVPLQRFEIIRDRIGEILAEELANQYDLTDDSLFNAPVFIERVIPFDKSDIPALNVCLSKGDYDNKDVTSVDGTYVYNIDCYASSPTRSDSRGDYTATSYLHRLLGVCRAVLENPAYRTLGYAPPFNCRVYVNRLLIADPGRGDAGLNVMGRLEVIVRVPETVELIEPILAGTPATTVKIFNTDKGYYWGPTDYAGPYLAPEEGEDLQFVSEDESFMLIPETA